MRTEQSKHLFLDKLEEERMKEYARKKLQEYKTTLQREIRRRHPYGAWDVVRDTPFPL